MARPWLVKRRVRPAWLLGEVPTQAVVFVPFWSRISIHTVKRFPVRSSFRNDDLITTRRSSCRAVGGAKSPIVAPPAGSRGGAQRQWPTGRLTGGPRWQSPRRPNGGAMWIDRNKTTPLGDVGHLRDGVWCQTARTDGTLSAVGTARSRSSSGTGASRHGSDLAVERRKRTRHLHRPA